MERIFVYGTLRVGDTAHDQIEPYVVAATPASVTGHLFALPGGYPGLVPHARDIVRGDLIVLRHAERAFVALDQYEGDEYQRLCRAVETDDRRSFQAWCYVLVDPGIARGCPRIESGDWRLYRGRDPGP